MNALDVQARLEYARAAVAVLRALKITDRTMRYADLARAIGLMSEDEKWEAPHRQQIRDILNLVQQPSGKPAARASSSSAASWGQTASQAPASTRPAGS